MIFLFKSLQIGIFFTNNQMVLVVKNLPANAEDIRDVGQEDPLEEGMVTHSSILAWRIPMNRGAWRATVHRVAESQT